MIQNLSGKRIVMTGATGFIGSHVAERFLEEGAEVYCLVRPESQKTDCLPVHEHLHRIPAQMDQAVECVPQIGHADAFLHFAWRGVNRQEIDSPAVQKLNIDGSLRCMEAAGLLGCQVFMDAGSRVEYGITADGTMEESMECHPVNEYGKAKLAFFEQAKQLCRELQLTYYHLRFFSVYGKGDHPWSIISTLTRELPEGKTVSLSACRHRWNFMDIAGCLPRCGGAVPLQRQPPGRCHAVNVASEDTRVLRDFVEEIHSLCGGSGNLEYGSFVQAKEGHSPSVRSMKTSEADRWNLEGADLLCGGNPEDASTDTGIKMWKKQTEASASVENCHSGSGQ